MKYAFLKQKGYLKYRLLFMVLRCCIFFTSGYTPKSNILLITSEDNGPGLGCYGAKDLETPFLDKLAQQGGKFQNLSSYALRSPSRLTLFTGLYTSQNGQVGLATPLQHV